MKEGLQTLPFEINGENLISREKTKDATARKKRDFFFCQTIAVSIGIASQFHRNESFHSSNA